VMLHFKTRGRVFFQPWENWWDPEWRARVHNKSRWFGLIWFRYLIWFLDIFRIYFLFILVLYFVRVLCTWLVGLFKRCKTSVIFLVFGWLMNMRRNHSFLPKSLACDSWRVCVWFAWMWNPNPRFWWANTCVKPESNFIFLQFLKL